MNDENDVLCKRFQAVDDMKYTPNHMIDANKTRTRKKPKQRQQMKTKLHYQRYRLRRRIWFTLRRVTRMVDDMHHKISSWLANNYRDVILPAFRTSEMVRKYTRDVVADVAPDICSQSGLDSATTNQPTQNQEFDSASDAGVSSLQVQDTAQVQDGPSWWACDRLQRGVYVEDLLSGCGEIK